VLLCWLTQQLVQAPPLLLLLLLCWCLGQQLPHQQQQQREREALQHPLVLPAVLALLVHHLSLQQLQHLQE
jgi:hypothetical protein